MYMCQDVHASERTSTADARRRASPPPMPLPSPPPPMPAPPIPATADAHRRLLPAACCLPCIAIVHCPGLPEPSEPRCPGCSPVTLMSYIHEPRCPGVAPRELGLFARCDSSVVSLLSLCCFCVCGCLGRWHVRTTHLGAPLGVTQVKAARRAVDHYTWCPRGAAPCGLRHRPVRTPSPPFGTHSNKSCQWLFL